MKFLGIYLSWYGNGIAILALVRVMSFVYRCSKSNTKIYMQWHVNSKQNCKNEIQESNMHNFHEVNAIGDLPSCIALQSTTIHINVYK